MAASRGRRWMKILGAPIFWLSLGWWALPALFVLPGIHLSGLVEMMRTGHPVLLGPDLTMLVVLTLAAWYLLRTPVATWLFWKVPVLRPAVVMAWAMTVTTTAAAHGAYWGLTTYSDVAVAVLFGAGALFAVGRSAMSVWFLRRRAVAWVLAAERPTDAAPEAPSSRVSWGEIAVIAGELTVAAGCIAVSVLSWSEADVGVRPTLKPVSFSCGESRVTYAKGALPGGGGSLRIERPGSPAIAQGGYLMDAECHSLTGGRAMVVAKDFSGGAHCCTELSIYDVSGVPTFRGRVPWGHGEANVKFGYSSDRGPELVARDASSLMYFGELSYAESPTLPRMFCLKGDAYSDCTTEFAGPVGAEYDETLGELRQASANTRRSLALKLVALGYLLGRQVEAWDAVEGVDAEVANLLRSQEEALRKALSSRGEEELNRRLASASPPDEADSLSAAEAREFTSTWVKRAASAANPGYVSGMYASEVNYFDRGVVPRSFVEEDKSAYLARWPERTIVIDGEIAISEASRPSTKEVFFRYAYTVKGDGRETQGRATTSLTLNRRHGAIAIVREAGTTSK